MRVFLADSGEYHFNKVVEGMIPHEPMRARFLLSYFYNKDVNLETLAAKFNRIGYKIDIFADSGAFSAATRHEEIRLEDYAKWLLKYRHLFTIYPNLDVIGDAKGTLRNQREMEDVYGLTPMPVFHAGEDWKFLEDYIRDYPYIGLGGLVTRSGPDMAWMVRCFKMAQGASVFHGFGVTSWRVLRSLRWYSADSSAWGASFRFGKLSVFNPHTALLHRVDMFRRKTIYRHAAVIREMGFDPEEFAVRANYNIGRVCVFSALTYMRTEEWLTRRFGDVTIPQRGKIPCAASTVPTAAQ